MLQLCVSKLLFLNVPEKDSVKEKGASPIQRSSSLRGSKREVVTSSRSEYLVAATSLTPNIKLGRQTPEEVVLAYYDCLYMYCYHTL